MWTLGIATALIGAAIALLLVFYLRLSAAEDAPEATTAKPSIKLKPFRRPEAPRLALETKRGDPSQIVPECGSAVILLFPDGAEDDGSEKAVPVLEAVLTADVERPLATASKIRAAITVSSARSS
jgi:hypothetical protein